MVEDITKYLSLIQLIRGPKVFTTQVVKCDLCDNKTVDALVVVFDDGHTVVGCPVNGKKHSCNYEIPPIPVKPWIKWTEFAVTILIILVFLSFAGLAFWLQITKGGKPA